MSDPVTGPDKKLLNLLGKLWIHLSRRRRTQLSAAVLLMLLSSLAEVVSLAAVIPFLAVLTNPEALWKRPLVQTCGSFLGISDAQGLLLPITFVLRRLRSLQALSDCSHFGLMAGRRQLVQI